MGKKCTVNNDDSEKKVSVVTITQLSRFECLLILYDLIQSQTYKNIIEWVIVEGSSNKADGEINKNNVTQLMNNHKLPFEIVYIKYSNQKLSDLRNTGNTKCSGDIIVCMDDDDYYPPERVEHAVESLNGSKCMIAGCSDVYMYDYYLLRLYKCDGFHQNHSTNNLMAFKKEYLLNHKHAPDLMNAEERSFTNDFTEPMVQLNPIKSIIISSHNSNTFNKRKMCIDASLGIHPLLYEINECITDYIPEPIFHRMKYLFCGEEP
jgi:glycosyltransferase involved in cell wall biosynthesis